MQHLSLMKKTVVITGGSRGIGNSIAHKFVKNNYNIITCSRLKNNLSELTKQLKKINSKIKFYIPEYNAMLFETFDKKIFRVTVRVVGQGDYLPTYAGNLDIITSSAVHLSKQINDTYINGKSKKNNN